MKLFENTQMVLKCLRQHLGFYIVVSSPVNTIVLGRPSHNGQNVDGVANFCR